MSERTLKAVLLAWGAAPIALAVWTEVAAARKDIKEVWPDEVCELCGRAGSAIDADTCEPVVPEER